MFYGLSNFLKNLLPKRLFYRALLIVATPIIILQITISVVFFDSLWIKTNKGMTRALINEIKFFIDAYDNEKYNKDSLTKIFSKSHNIKVKYIPNKILAEDDQERWFSPMDRTLRRELKSQFGNFIDLDALGDLKSIDICSLDNLSLPSGETEPIKQSADVILATTKEVVTTKAEVTKYVMEADVKVEEVTEGITKVTDGITKFEGTVEDLNEKKFTFTIDPDFIEKQ